MIHSRALFLLFFLSLILCAFVTSGAAVPQGMPTAECLSCHNDPSLTKDVNGRPVSVSVNEEKFKASTHGGVLQCNDCHSDIKGYPHEPTPAKVSCATCHSEQQANYDKSLHARVKKAGNASAATCADCHGNVHELLAASLPASKVNHARIPATCGACHGQKFVMQATGRRTQPFLSYQESVHGRAVAAGNQKAAVCTDCHRSHDILGAGDPSSPIFKFNVPQTCASCHQNIKTEFMGSIHGQAIQRGNWTAPVCTDCHGIHAIKAVKDPGSPVSAQQLALNTCARCHEGMRLTQEFGVPGRRSRTYMSSYHGLAVQGGSKIAANCASCHGVHNILPSSDPRSMVHESNLVQTCGQCHPGATENFARGQIHIDVPLSADIGSKAVRWIRRFYLLVIGLTVGGMVLHNFIVWRRKAIARRNAEDRVVERMDKFQRIQHLILLISFTVLVLTGFALRYPDSWFASFLLLNETVRGVIHRIAGVALIGVSLFHLGYVALHRGGRRMIADMLPTIKDARDVVATFRYYLGFSHDKPQYGRFNYGEKFEYLALVWGTVLMSITGIALWANVWASHLGPRWLIDVATAIHFYEAILATLAILVWHFYQVFMDPDVYPMNWAWYDGRMSIEHYAEEHGADKETIATAVEGVARERAAREAGDKPASERREDPPAEPGDQKN